MQKTHNKVINLVSRTPRTYWSGYATLPRKVTPSVAQVITGVICNGINRMDHDWKPTTESIAPKDVDLFLSNNPFVVIHFWADWNMIDREADKMLQTLDRSLVSHIKIVSFDTGPKEAWKFARECNILNLPAFAIFKNGKLLETIIGMRNKDDFSKNLSIVFEIYNKPRA